MKGGNPKAREAKRWIEIQEQIERWSADYNKLAYLDPQGRLQEGRQEWEGGSPQRHALLSSVLLRPHLEKKVSQK